MLVQLLANGAVNGCVLALAAAGFGLIFRTTRVFHVGHGATYTIGAYVGYMLIVAGAWPLPLAMAGVFLLTGGLGVVMGWALYEPLFSRRASFMVLLLTSLGSYIALVNVVVLLFGPQNRLLDPALHQPIQVGSIMVSRAQTSQVLGAMLVLIPIWAAIERSPLLRDLRAVQDNPRLAEAIGVHLGRTRALAFGIGSALVGSSAVLSGLDAGIDPYHGMSVFLLSAVIVIVGGTHRIVGPVLGALALGCLQGIAAWMASTRWVDALTFTVLVLALIMRPQGLLGESRRVDEAGQ